jgi:hypothetical protein
MPHDVFISYSSVNKLEADAICAGLENEKIRCCIAPRDFTAGVPYATEIEAAIAGCKILVVVLSQGANDSAHVMREVERAIHFGKPIIPFKVENVALRGQLSYFLSSIHWLDAITPPVERHIENLRIAVQSLMAGRGWESGRGVRSPESWKRLLMRGFWASLVCLVLLPVCAGILTQASPIWPSRSIAIAFTILVNLIVLALVFVGWQSAKHDVQRRRLWPLSAVGVASLFAYLAMVAAFVWDAPTPDVPEVGGFLLRPQIVELLDADKAETVQSLFDGAECRPFAIWIPWTVVVNRVGMLTAWLVFFGCLSAIITILGLWIATRSMRPGQAQLGPA